jgi:hypothetical protein
MHDSLTLWSSTLGLSIRFQDVPDEQGDILSHLNTYLERVASEIARAVVTDPPNISALMTSAFADVRGINGVRHS